MDFEFASEIADIETIAAGRRIRDLSRLRRLYGKGHWRKMKGMVRARSTLISRRGSRRGRRFVVCVRNDGYEASLERNKIYAVLPDVDAERDGDLRIIDESGQDYLFPADRFVSIDVPAAVKASLRNTARA